MDENAEVLIPNITAPADHRIAYEEFRFDVISHTYNDDLFSDVIPNLFEVHKGKFCSDFTKSAKKHFENHLDEFMSKGVFSIPYLDENTSITKPFLNGPVNSIMNCMKNWCCKNESGVKQKGFVIYSYNLDSHLTLLKFPENVLQRHLYKTSEDSHETVIVYNAVIQVILLIRIAAGKNLENDMKLSTNDMIKFMLIFHDVLNQSGIKLINLLVTDEGVNYQSKCDSCKHQIISVGNLSSVVAYERWWKKKKSNFRISVIHKDLNEKFSFEFSAKALGLLTYFKFSYKNKYFRTLPYQIKYLTPDQTKIVYLPRKHLIINGCSESGKSVVALKKAEIILSRLKPDEIMRYITCNSSNMPRGEIPLNADIVIDNRSKQSEITIIQQLLKEYPEKRKFNIIFDNFVSENLNEAVAKKLNLIFKTNEKLKDSDIILVPQRLQKEEAKEDNRRKGNYEMLETFSQSEELTRNMRIIGSDHQSMERDEKFESIKQRLESIKQRLEKATVITSKESIKQRFESIKQRFESIKQRFELMKNACCWTERDLGWTERDLGWTERDLDSIERRLDSIERRLGWTERDLDWIERRLGWIEQDLGWTERDLEDMERWFEPLQHDLASKGGKVDAMKKSSLEYSFSIPEPLQHDVASKGGKVGDSSGPSRD